MYLFVPNKRQRRELFFAVLSFCFCFSAVFSAHANVPQDAQRKAFEEAVVALKSGDLATFEKLAAANKDYVLYPYLRYYELRERISQADRKEIDRFLKTYQEYPFSSAVRSQWLEHLADEKEWSQYFKYYDGETRTDLKCHYFTASLAGKVNKSALKELLTEAEELWLSSRKDPKECKPIFEALKSYQRITTAMRWQRIELAMEVGNIKLAKELSKTFGSRDKKLVALWQKAYKNPEKVLRFKQMRRNGLVQRKIAYQAIQRLAKRDVEKATTLWRKAKRRFPFDAEQKHEMVRFLALRSAYQSKPDALKLLKQVPKNVSNQSDKFLRAQVALKQQNWKELLSAIKVVNPGERKEAKWRYWQARAWEQLGYKKKARTGFEKLATETNYYGFLAADRVKKPYRFTIEPLHRDESGIAALQQNPGVQRAQELYALDRITEARREWDRVITKLDEELIKLAAVMAHDWQWYDNAILTVAKTSHRKDLHLRFPTPYKDLIFQTAENYGIDPEWIYGVTRRESAFNMYARSSAGALGLMQILPSTARMQSKSLGMARPSHEDLLESERNILLGASYLNKMLERFSGNQVLATAAYNAGPNRVSKWLPKEGDKVSADIWVDTIPYKETREYVRAVMAYATIFEWKLNQTVTPLYKRMEKI